jgi:hypothetical protein
MKVWIFIAGLALVLVLIFRWSFRTLPGERWQILATVPVAKTPAGTWQGLNLTYYGVFNALALCAAVALMLMLAGAAGMTFKIIAGVVCALLGFCLPASRLIARWVEGKAHTFSVGAAVFIGILLGPWLLLFVEFAAADLFAVSIAPLPVLAAALVGYALGEGIGRLACISFGCCYGRPMASMPAWVQRYCSWMAFTYTGATKKVAYAHHLEGQKVFAVQAVTAVLYCAGALAGTLLFLQGAFGAAFLLCLTVTQGWRFCSEFFRADYRGDRKISAYQIMSLVAIPYGAIIIWLFPEPVKGPELMAGIRLLWDPLVILFLQALGLMMFLRAGRSQVTGAELTFHVHLNRV